MFWNKKQEGKMKDRNQGEQKFAAADVILEAMIDGVAVADMNGNIVQYNTTYANMFGLERTEEAIGINLTETIAEREIPRVMEVFKTQAKIGDIKNLEFIGRNKSGKEFPVLLNGVLLKDKEGKIVGNLAVVRDITELKKAQEELTKAKAYSEGLIACMVDGLWVIDLQGKTIDVNPAMAKMLGYENRAELIKKNPADVTPKESSEVTVRLIQESLQGKPCAGEINVLKKDGKELPVSIAATAKRDINGKIIGGFAVLRDITELKRAQEESVTLNEELKSSNEELESTNEELRQANEELESTTEELRLSNEEAQKAKEAAEKKAAELERFNKVAVGRELEMRKLKERIAQLEAKLGEKA